MYLDEVDLQNSDIESLKEMVSSGIKYDESLSVYTRSMYWWGDGRGDVNDYRFGDGSSENEGMGYGSGYGCGYGDGTGDGCGDGWGSGNGY